MISTVDPDARHTRKSPEARRDGYRAHLAADPETGIITDEKLTRAAGTENSDPAAAEEFVAAEAAACDAASGGTAGSSGGSGEPDDGAGPGPSWYGDPAYGTGDLRGAIEDAGHRAVMKPKPLHAPVEGGFTVGDFTVDEQAGTVTCPAGRTVALSRTRVATFGVLCRDCPLRAQCTPCKIGRHLVLHERDDLLRAARAGWAAGSGLCEDYMTHRPNVERAIAQVATWRGRRLRLRYRGTDRNHAWPAATAPGRWPPDQPAGHPGMTGGPGLEQPRQAPRWPVPARQPARQLPGTGQNTVPGRAIDGSTNPPFSAGS